MFEVLQDWMNCGNASSCDELGLTNSKWVFVFRENCCSNLAEEDLFNGVIVCLS